MKRELFLVFKITKIYEIHAIELALLREKEREVAASRHDLGRMTTGPCCLPELPSKLSNSRNIQIFVI
jgi:hypothetical protein